MPTDPTEGDAPTVDITARPDDVALRAPDTNPALQLAAALADTSTEIHPFLTDVAGQLKARDEARATADAWAASKPGFANAVRTGQIEQTQSPWYMHQYEKVKAQAQAQGQVAALVTQMQTDPTRNDPQAFQAKFHQSLGAIAQQFPGLNASAGFHAAADPLAEQALSQNVEYNVQRIGQENVQAHTSVATQAIMDTLKANPKATPDQLFASLDDQHKSWIDTGQTERSWRLVVKQAVFGAAANTHDDGLVDVLQHPYEGSSPIANDADETGKPTGLEMDQAKRTIIWATENDLTADMKVRQAAIAKEGASADDFFQQKYGNDYAFGKVPLPQLQTDGVAAGFSGNAINWAAGKMKESLLGAAGYATAQADLYSTDPNVQKDILGLNTMARTEGLSPRVTAKINDMVGRQQLTTAQAEQMEDAAVNTSHFNTEQSKEDVRQKQSLQRADAGLALQRFSLVGDSIKQAKAKAATLLSNPVIGIDFGKLPTKVQDSFNKDVEDAGMAVADKGPLAAQEAAEDKAAELSKTLIQRYRPSKLPTGLTNPNANPGKP